MSTQQHPQAIVTVLNDNDVLVGRGYAAVEYVGNIRFRRVVETRRSEYRSESKRNQKDVIARSVLESINDSGGRFLKKIEKLDTHLSSSLPSGTVAWEIVSEREVLVKVKQALRGKRVQARSSRSKEVVQDGFRQDVLPFQEKNHGDQ